MRNLSLEAARLSERDLIAQDPRLGDPMFRKKLSPQVKEQVFMQLFLMAPFFEQMLLDEMLREKQV